MKGRSLTVLLVAGVLVLAGLLVLALSSTETPAETVDFIGEVESVTFGPEWHRSGGALAGGGPEGQLLVGPGEITLVGGQGLEIPPDTPGSNYCLALIHPDDVPGIVGFDSVTDAQEIPRFIPGVNWSGPCVVMGKYDDAGLVSWFDVLPAVEYGGAELGELGSVDHVDFDQHTVLTFEGLIFELRTDTSECGRDLEGAVGLRALVDWHTGDVVALLCAFSG